MDLRTWEEDEASRRDLISGKEDEVAVHQVRELMKDAGSSNIVRHLSFFTRVVTNI